MSSNVDRSSVPHQDFVLMIRNDSVNKPLGLVSKWPDGTQAVAVSIMPDFMTAKQRLEIQKQLGINPAKIDSNPNIVYKTVINENDESEEEELITKTS